MKRLDTLEYDEKGALETMLDKSLEHIEDMIRGKNIYNKLLLIALGFNSSSKKQRRELALCWMPIAEIYLRDAESKGYLNLPKFQLLVKKFDSLAESLECEKYKTLVAQYDKIAGRIGEEGWTS